LVSLRPITKEDIEQIRIWRNKSRQWFVYKKEISPEQQLAWWETYSKSTNDQMFVIETDKPIGAVALYNIEADRAEFGRLMIGEDGYAKKGYAVAATQLLLEYGFKKMALTEIFLEVFKDNRAARKVYEKAGFKYSGEKGDMVMMTKKRKAAVVEASPDEA
jgi:RimJ/RimL family protein N-acetyltransferase